ncbi:MAG TPA: hypothetical protein PLK82_08390, partial [Bacteroidales bacterium]|nr:hypothetical protein [Bacteroidales bacterium]
MSSVTRKVSVCMGLLLFLPFLANTYAQDLNSAIKLTKSEQFSLAASLFKKLIAQEPANGDLYYYYGRNCLEKYFSDTLNISFREKADSARAIYENGLRQDPSNPLNLVGLGGLKLIGKDFTGASAEYEKARALLPSKANKAIKMDPARQALEFARFLPRQLVHFRRRGLDCFRRRPRLRLLADGLAAKAGLV